MKIGSVRAMAFGRFVYVGFLLALVLTALSTIVLQHVALPSYEAYRYGFPLPWLEHYVNAAGLNPDLWSLPPYLVLNFVFDILFWIGVGTLTALLLSRVHVHTSEVLRK